MADKIDWGAGTPGPWHRSPHTNAVHQSCADWRNLSAVAVCVRWGTQSQELAIANARAIAEVPAMVVALRNVLSTLVSPEVSDAELPALMVGSPVTLDAEIVPAIIKARAILARIDGEG